jgi:uncharacterized protein
MTLNLKSLSAELERKQRALQEYIASLGSVLVAYSGGIDSAYLAWAAHRILGHQMLAVIADSPSLPRRELRLAISFAEDWNIPLQIIATGEMDRGEYTKNDIDRCFHCKHELFSLMHEQRRRVGFAHIVYGRNLDDDTDFRPGKLAAKLHQVVAPLAEAGLSKTEVRELARVAGLSLWDKPASACLSSRIEYGRAVTAEVLAQVEAGEEALHRLGFTQVRVRHHGEIARIEIAQDDFHRAFTPEMAKLVVPIFKKIGFNYVTFDCEGYRSGSMNAVVPVSQLQRLRRVPERQQE